MHDPVPTDRELLLSPYVNEGGEIFPLRTLTAIALVVPHLATANDSHTPVALVPVGTLRLEDFVVVGVVGIQVLPTLGSDKDAKVYTNRLCDQVIRCEFEDVLAVVACDCTSAAPERIRVISGTFRLRFTDVPGSQHLPVTSPALGGHH